MGKGISTLLLAPEGEGRDWPLRFYSRELLFSREARLGWAEPNLAALPELPELGALRWRGLGRKLLG